MPDDEIASWPGQGSVLVRAPACLAGPAGDILTQLAIWVPLLIAAGHVLVFTAWTGWVSFTPSTLLPESGWVGLRNYRAIMRTANFQVAYVNW